MESIFDNKDNNYYSYITQAAPAALPAKHYFITITTRKRFVNKENFISALNAVLFATNYPKNIEGYIEYSENTGYHLHGVTCHKYNHFKKKSGWFSLVKNIDNMNVVQMYITKNRNESI